MDGLDVIGEVEGLDGGDTAEDGVDAGEVGDGGASPITPREAEHDPPSG